MTRNTLPLLFSALSRNERESSDSRSPKGQPVSPFNRRVCRRGFAHGFLAHLLEPGSDRPEPDAECLGEFTDAEARRLQPFEFILIYDPARTT